MQPIPSSGRPILVVSSDADFQKRTHKMLLELPLTAPGLPQSVRSITARTPNEAARTVARTQQNGGLFGVAIVDDIASAVAIWSQDPTLPILHIGIPDSPDLATIPPTRLMVLPRRPHPIMLQQAVLVLAGRATTESSLQADVIALRTRLTEQEAARSAMKEGALDALSDLLTQIDPDLAERAVRISNLVGRIAETLGLSSPTALLIAGRMSMLGMASLSEATREKIRTGAALDAGEERARRLHLRTGQKVLSRLPEMKEAAVLLSLQALDRSGVPLRLHPRKHIEATILHIALEIDIRICNGFIPLTAAEDLTADPPPSLRSAIQDRTLMAAVHAACLQERDVRIAEVQVEGLRPGMILYDDVLTTRGAMIVSRNEAVHTRLIQRLKRFAAGVGIQEPLRVLVR